MKSLRVVLCLITTVLSVHVAGAQEISKEDSLQNVIHQYVRKVIDLENQLKNTEKELETSRIGWGAAAAALGNTIDSLNTGIATLSSNLASMQHETDSTRALFCYIRLGQRYNKKWVDGALSIWSKITDSEVLKEFENTNVLLSNYKDYYNEVRSVLVNAQGDVPGRTDTNIRMSHFKSDTIKALKDTDYYKNWYNNYIRINYLNRVIDQAINHLENTPVGKYDFTYLIEFLLPEIKE